MWQSISGTVLRWPCLAKPTLSSSHWPFCLAAGWTHVIRHIFRWQRSCRLLFELNRWHLPVYRHAASVKESGAYFPRLFTNSPRECSSCFGSAENSADAGRMFTIIKVLVILIQGQLRISSSWFIPSETHWANPGGNHCHAELYGD